MPRPAAVNHSAQPPEVPIRVRPKLLRARVGLAVGRRAQVVLWVALAALADHVLPAPVPAHGLHVRRASAPRTARAPEAQQAADQQLGVRRLEPLVAVLSRLEGIRAVGARHALVLLRGPREPDKGLADVALPETVLVGGQRRVVHYLPLGALRALKVIVAFAEGAARATRALAQQTVALRADRVAVVERVQRVARRLARCALPQVEGVVDEQVSIPAPHELRSAVRLQYVLLAARVRKPADIRPVLPDTHLKVGEGRLKPLHCRRNRRTEVTPGQVLRQFFVAHARDDGPVVDGPLRPNSLKQRAAGALPASVLLQSRVELLLRESSPRGAVRWRGGGVDEVDTEQLTHVEA
mmetsp:Transcript_31205/g.73531  ORF Transcript_31205/g.73531 Transcript_31205/m.73531 type:complete len:353 (+) Transcript_31205:4640-5698(+)